MSGRLYSAQPCDDSDPAPGVRLIRAGEVLNRLTVLEALRLGGELLEAAGLAVVFATEEKEGQ
jgi:hypothetical protein